MLKTHMNAVEKYLTAAYQLQISAGHSLHKGTPRELFIKDFLETHLNSDVSIGTGEIIDANSVPGKRRNQYDIVIYKKNYPKIDFGGVNGFLIESVIATIEIKSLLDEPAIEQAVKAAYNSKELSLSVVPEKMGFVQGWSPPKILNFVVSYTGPAKMETAYKWVIKNHEKLSIPLPSWNDENRLHSPGTALDGIFVLNKGFIKLDNTLLSVRSKDSPKKGIYTISDSESNNVLLLFLCLHQACVNIKRVELDPTAYIRNVTFPNLQTL